MSRRRVLRFGRASVLWCALGWAAWAVFSWAADPPPVAANGQPALLWNVSGEVLEVRAGERATLIVEAADPDADASGRPEAAQLHAEWVSGASGEAAPGWSAEPHWTTGPSAEPRLILTLSPPLDAVPGRHTLLVGATDARGLTALRTLSVRVLSAEVAGGPGGASGGAGASGEAGPAGPRAPASDGAASSSGAWTAPASTDGEPHWDGPVPVYVEERGAGGASGVSGQSSPGWSVSLALNDTAGGGTLLSDGYLTAAERTSGGSASAVKILLSIDDPSSIGSFTFMYAKLRSDPGACTATTGTFQSSTDTGLRFSDFTADGPYFFCLKVSDGTTTVYAGPVGFTVDTAAPTLGNATYTLPDPAGASHAGRLAHTAGGSAALDGALSVFVKGSYAYVASSASGALEVVNVSNPGSPSHAGKLVDGEGGAELSNASRVFVRGDHAYVAAGGSGGALQIVDISDPSSPSHAGKLSLNDPMGVFVRGDYAYVALDSGDALAVVDVRNPAEPRSVSTHSLAVGGARRVHVSGNRAYVTQLDLVRAGFTTVARSALEVVDVSDPASPSRTATVYHDMDLSDATGSGALLDSPRGVAVQGTSAYVAAFDSDALQVLDVSTASSPRAAGALTHDATAGVLLDGAAGLAVRGDYAYVAAYGSDALTMVDISDPSSPAHAASVTEADALDGAFGVFVRGNRAYVTSWDDDALEVITVGKTRARIGEAVTVELDASEDVAVSAFTVNGVAATGVTQVGSQVYATYTVRAGHSDAAQVPYAVTATDRAGHSTSAMGQLSLAVDATAPRIETLTFDGTAATLTLSEAVWSPSAPAAGDFAVTEDGSAISVSTVTAATSADTASRTIALTTAAALTGAQVSVRYTPNADTARRPRDGAGNELAAQTVQASRQATLSVTAPTIGGYVTGTNGAGTKVIDCGSGARTDCTATVNSGSALTLTAMPDSGYLFGGWSGACTGKASSCSVTVNADVGVTAAFGLARTLTVTAPSNGTIAGADAGGEQVIACGTDCSATLIDGASVTLTAAPASGYALSAWGGACAAETTSSCALTMNANKSVSATFVIPVPGAVRNLSGSAVGSDVTLGWDAPDTGGTPTGYTVAGGGTAIVSGTTATVTGLNAETEYTFTVTATNAGGSGPGTDVTVSTQAAPGDVENLSGAPAGSNAALLQWDAPATGGTASEYEVTGSGTVGVTGTSAAITGLSPQTEYTWTVKAKNSSGSSAGVEVTVTTLAAGPGAVGGVRVTAVGTDTASLAWSAPAEGGAPTGYTVTGGGTASISGTAATITGLTDGTTYTFSVAATNAGGAGQAVPVQVRTGAPAAVGDLRVEAATATTAHLSWAVSPAGGTPTGYTVAGGGTATVTGTQARVTGLAAGTAYTFSVTAVNGAGSSAAAAVAKATPADDDLPGAVGDLQATAVNAATAQLAWAAPFTRGAPTGYTVTGGGTATVSGTGASIAGLADGSSYTFSVTGSNGLGTGEAATVGVVTGTPGAVRDLKVDAKTASTVDLAWTAPSGGGTPTGYTVAGGDTVHALPGTRARVSGLAAETAYTFSVNAYNDAGSGTTASLDVTTTSAEAAPGAVRELRIDSASADAVRLSWAIPDTGGAPTGYAVTGGGTATVTGTSASIAGLAANGTYTFSVAGNNPAGAGEATTIGVTTGTPGTVRALRVDGRTADAVNLSWLPPSGGGTPTGYSVAGGGTAVVDGTRARITGLSLDTAYTFTVSAVNAAGAGAGTAVDVRTVDFMPTLEAVGDRTATVDVELRLVLPEAEGGNRPLTYTLSGLPDNLSFDAAKRTVSGTPTAVQSYSLTYTATDADGDRAEATFTLTIEADAEPTLSVSDRAAAANKPMNLILPEAVGGNAPLTHALIGLPAPLSFDAASRTVSGTPTSKTAYMLTYTATDNDGDKAEATFTLTIEDDTAPMLPSVSNETGVENLALSLILPAAMSGNAPLTYGLTGLPGTLSFDAASRTVNGTPGTGDLDDHTLTYTVTDADGDEDSESFTLTVEDDTEPTVTAGDRTAVPGTALDVTLPEGSGGNAPLSYALTGLPDTLSFDAATRKLSGTPGTDDVGEHELTYTVTDRDGDTAKATFTLTVGSSPGAVENLEATSVGTDSVSLSWDAPSTGSAPTSYAVTGGGTATVSGTMATITGLTDATAYTFSVTASNAAGSGAATQIAVTTGTPGAVGNLTLTSVGTTSVSLSWNAPASGGTPTSYSVTGGGTATVSGTTATISGLTDATAYTFSVAASNAAGASITVQIAVTTGTPGAVGNLTPTSVGTTSVSLSWDAPASGGTPTSYSVTGGGTVTISGTTATITGLTDATAYTFSVTAGNAAGTGTAVQIAVTTGTPGAVRNLTGSATGETALSLDWDAPTTGGTPTGYSVTASGVSSTQIAVSGTSATVTGLSAGTSYAFSVTASNAGGSSAAETVSVTTWQSPGAVGSLSGSADSTSQVSLNWAAPATGTPAIFTYEVTAPGVASSQISVSGTSATVTGLSADTSYTFTVTATNSAGAGPGDDVTVKTPVQSPGPVGNLTGNPTGTTSVSLDWDAPSTGGTPTGYSVTASGVSASQINVSGTGATVTGLTANTGYTFSVTASNAGGSSSPETVSVTTWQLPGAVRSLSGSADSTSQISLSWAAPSVGNPASFTYAVSASGVAASQISTSGTSATVTGLSADTSYTFTVKATNRAGTGPAETVAVRTDENAPGPVRDLEGTATGTSTVSLDWDAPNTGGTTSGYWVSATGVDSSQIAISGTSATVTGLTANTQYSFRVYATNGGGWSSSRTAIVTTWDLPGPPENLSGSATGATSVSLSWDPPKTGNPPTFTYSVSASGVEASQISVSGTSATVTGLSCNTAYTFSVTARNSAGAGTDTVSVTTLLPVPGAVQNLSSSATGTTTVSLDWDAPSGCGTPSGYSVSGSGTVTVSGTAATVTGLTTGTEYEFSVTATNSAGSGPAVSVSVTTWQLPNSPQNFSASATGTTSASLSWNAPSEGIPSTFTYSVSASGVNASQISVSGTSATVTGLTAGTDYSFSVTATNSAGTGTAASDSVTTWQLPGQPQSLSVSVTGTTTASLSWNAPSTGIPSTFTYSVSASGVDASQISVSGNSATVTGLTAGTEYTFSVAATNSAGTGPATTDTVTTWQLPGPVQNLVDDGDDDTHIRFVWDAPATGNPATFTYNMTAPGVSSSQIYIDTSYSDDPDDPDVGAEVGGLTPNTEYIFTVTATNSAGTGPGTSINAWTDIEDDGSGE